MNSIGATITILIALVVFLAPRQWAALAVIAGVCYVTQGQQIYLIGFHFTAIRIIILVGFLRCLLRGDIRRLKLNGIDKAALGYALAELCVYTARERTQVAFVYMLGVTYDVFLSYLLFRCLIATVEDAQTFFRRLAFLIVPFALFMFMESLTGQNIFSSMGGQGWDTAYFREGRVRCVASFRGPHSAGVFGATLAPMFFGLWFAGGWRLASVVGLLASVFITFTSNSSGPLTAFVSSLIGLSFWFVRGDMQLVRRGIVVTLIALHLVMKAPVWFLFSKMSSVLGGDGYTRSLVIDQAVGHFSEWWLLGKSNTIQWMWDDPTLLGEMDLTDQFVGSAMCGGLLGLIFFILVFVRGFSSLGLAMEAVREQSTESVILLWCLGAALFAHLMALFSVGYFDQISVVWWGLVAIISSVTTNALAHASVAPTPDNSETDADSDGVMAEALAKEHV